MGVDAAAIPEVGLPSDRLRLAKPDLGGLTLKPEEMFVVSRLAGADLRVSDLLASSGLPRPQAIAVVARLLQAGVFQNLDGQGVSEPPRRPTMPARPAGVAAAQAPRSSPPTTGPPLEALDPAAVDLPPDRQHEVAGLLARVRSKNPREVLGVTPTATADEIRTAYFALAQRFHPDQFFRKKLGSFKAKIEEIFSRSNWAFQELTRNPNAGTDAPAAAPAAPAAMGEPRPGDELPPADDLPAMDENELPLPDDGMPPAAAAGDDEEAAQITGRPRDRYRKAMLRQRWDLAAAAVEQLSRDEPNALDVPKLRAELGRKKAEVEAKALFDKGNTLGAQGNWGEAFKCFQQAASLDSRNAAYIERAGRALLYEGDLKEAKRLVERALELKPDDASAHVTLANVFLKAGMERNAKREFETALKIDPKNEYAKGQVRKGWWKG